MSENLGFLTVIDQSSSGLTGGYLVLNKTGRPLEFHCTVPMCPEKIQQILYGDALQPFLYGEKIAQTLIQRSKLPVLAVLTNYVSVLPAQPLVSMPVVYVFDEAKRPALPNDVDAGDGVREISEELNESLKGFGINNANLRTRDAYSDALPQVPWVLGFETEPWKSVRLGNRLIAVPEMQGADWNDLVAKIKELAKTIDVLEPFSRIRLALEEAKNAA
ncbi:MAG: hypothetical protein FWG73_03265 [Planctomycetaceae bacterium]|nr:hypothetical protein [Planctomycetaceae bacterium]